VLSSRSAQLLDIKLVANRL